ncbi:putative membrane protein YeaQ/YmgE (transglycosylase-associated protein family) [Saccharothrix tamanrassetensis]|uniref:Putative membrane protein YeaQ/YmgE (Transglycosylase-associated protein family) n=1 Tax=Saccharothrix tamanrassetensis TaxID=1051531 RepID=A0A841CJE0_9PSEU|nr:GlsB/YeaQ/YmgE family stress response membrane protein [Saccharothrix tamanrassetensis]MBB5957581.1 putative membrane protein YeaQ/YmgE (transglycosylase-associated protein family) [Saccharothrix tamanrassetensis]
MEITGIISALFIGVLIGGLGRLVVPGKQKISLLMTVLVGIAAALVGTFAASAFGVSDTGGIDWIELALQVGLAGVGVAILAGRSKVRRHQ